MEIKLGMYVRTKTNGIHRINKDDMAVYNDIGRFAYDPRHKEMSTPKNSANTPQELIEVGDIIITSINELFRVGIVCDYEDNKRYFYDDDELYECEDDNVIEIWTRTSEDTYTRQWVKE